MTRIFDFSDGFTSSTAPSSVGIESSGYATHVDDAAYVTAKGSAAEDGNAYYNTTDNKVRIYENGSWVESASFEA